MKFFKPVFFNLQDFDSCLFCRWFYLYRKKALVEPWGFLKRSMMLGRRGRCNASDSSAQQRRF